MFNFSWRSWQFEMDRVHSRLQRRSPCNDNNTDNDYDNDNNNDNDDDDDDASKYCANGSPQLGEGI